MFPDRVYEVMNEAIDRQVAAVGNMDPAWPTREVSKRIAKHMNKATKEPELLSNSWQDICEQFIGRFLRGYSASCGDLEWYYRIDLAPALADVLMETLSLRGHRCSFDSVLEFVKNEYDVAVDEQMLEKALWTVCEKSKFCGKLSRALSRTYWPAFDVALRDGNLAQDISEGLDVQVALKRIELFIKTWLTDALGRAWVALNEAGGLNQDGLIALLKNIIAPFGLQNPYSCLPGALIGNLGRPPLEWTYVTEFSRDLCASWGIPSSSFKKQSQKKGRLGEIPSDVPHAEVPPVPPLKRPRKEPKIQIKEDLLEEQECSEECNADADACTDIKSEGHRLCTSAEDCVGHPHSKLLQHLLDDQLRDIYCEQCWKSFEATNGGRSLQAIPFEEL